MEPWQLALHEGRTENAWDEFVERYRRLILATIRRLVADRDDVMDVFASVCAALSQDNCARLANYSAQSLHRASVATWLVVVVRNLTVDWLRARDGRRRPVIPAVLTALQQEIYRALCLDGRSHVEAYEVVCARTQSTMSFLGFLREVRVTHRVAPCQSPAVALVLSGDVDVLDVPSLAPDPALVVETSDAARRIAGIMADLPPDLRLAVELFIVEGMAAEDVARVVGWAGAKAVYNRVHRALSALRRRLTKDGIGPGDL